MCGLNSTVDAYGPAIVVQTEPEQRRFRQLAGYRKLLGRSNKSIVYVRFAKKERVVYTSSSRESRVLIDFGDAHF